ncbi:MAG: immunoglobulin-like domain-containing protein [Glaciecola sp.]|jgi:hypothetical protein
MANAWSIEVDGLNDTLTLSSPAAISNIGDFIELEFDVSSNDFSVLGELPPSAGNFLAYDTNRWRFRVANSGTVSEIVTAPPSIGRHIIKIERLSNGYELFVDDLSVGTFAGQPSGLAPSVLLLSIAAPTINGQFYYAKRNVSGSDVNEWRNIVGDTEAQLSDIIGTNHITLDGFTSPPPWALYTYTDGTPATVPVITVVEGNQTINVGDANPTWTATTNDGSTVTIDDSAIDNSSAGGPFTVFFDANNAQGSAVQVTRTVTVEAAAGVTNLDSAIAADQGSVPSGGNMSIDFSSLTASGGIKKLRILQQAPRYKVPYSNKNLNDEQELVSGSTFTTIAPTVEANTTLNYQIEVTDNGTSTVTTKDVTFTVLAAVGTMIASTGADINNATAGDNVTLLNTSTASIGRSKTIWEQISGPYIPELIGVKTQQTPTIPFPDALTATTWADDLRRDFKDTPVGTPKIPIGLKSHVDIKLEGYFRLFAAGESGGAYGQGVIGLSENGQSIYMVGRDSAVAKWTIPASYGTDPTLANITNATEIHPYVRMFTTPGGTDRLTQTVTGQDRVDRISGITEYSGSVFFSCYVQYDGGGTNENNFFKAMAGDNTLAPEGFFKIGGSEFATGGISKIPAALQNDFGADFIIGGGNLDSITSRWSHGQSIVSVNSVDLLAADTLTSTSIFSSVIQGYEFDTHSLVTGNTINQDIADINPLWTSGSKSIYGFFIPNTDLFVAFGRQNGDHSGRDYKGLQNDFDTNPQDGNHPVDADDYSNRFWLWKTSDILANQNIWDAQPISFGKIHMGLDQYILGVAFDEVNGKVYFSIEQENDVPVIACFTFKARDENSPAINKPSDVIFNLTEINSEGVRDESTFRINATQAQPDTTAPIITVSGNASTTIAFGGTIPTFTASTDDGSTVVVGGDTVDNNTAGTYVITYNATDAAGNAATEVTRTVTVEAATVTPPTEDANMLARATFTLQERFLNAYRNTDNVQILKFKSAEGEQTNSFFDFDQNGITRVEVLLKNSAETVSIDSTTNHIGFSGNELSVCFGAFNVTGNCQVIIKVYSATLTNGLVICAPGYRESNLLVNVYE